MTLNHGNSYVPIYLFSRKWARNFWCVLENIHHSRGVAGKAIEHFKVALEITLSSNIQFARPFFEALIHGGALF